MQIVSEVQKILEILMRLNNRQVNSCLRAGNGGVELLSGGLLLTKVGSKKIILCGKDITEELLAKKDGLNIKTDGLGFEKFMGKTSRSVTRLNHIGISYWCRNIEIEVDFYKELMKNTSFHLYEEKSDDINTRWLFIGDKDDWQSPLFEIVLTTKYVAENQWRPHFQIDIDTSLEQGELEENLSKCFGKDFIQWKLDIPNYGVVLEMGMLGSVSGSKIYLGVGTKIRDTKYHREKGLALVV